MSLNDWVCTRNQSKQYKHIKNTSCQVEQEKSSNLTVLDLWRAHYKNHEQLYFLAKLRW